MHPAFASRTFHILLVKNTGSEEHGLHLFALDTSKLCTYVMPLTNGGFVEENHIREGFVQREPIQHKHQATLRIKLLCSSRYHSPEI